MTIGKFLKKKEVEKVRAEIVTEATLGHNERMKSLQDTSIIEGRIEKAKGLPNEADGAVKATLGEGNGVRLS